MARAVVLWENQGLLRHHHNASTCLESRHTMHAALLVAGTDQELCCQQGTLTQALAADT
jgi:hypothetical protein